MSLKQEEHFIETEFVSVDSPVFHQVVIEKSDSMLLENMYKSVYWFLNCEYLDKTTDFTLKYQYYDSNEESNLLALVVASMDPVN